MAFQLLADYDRDIAQNINLKLQYQFFADYRNLEAIDHWIDLTLTGKINNIVNTNLSGVIL